MKSSLIELIMVMTLLVLFGMTIFTLMYSGADTQDRIMREKNTQIDARIAVSYINVKLRQNDMLNRDIDNQMKIGVRPISLTGRNAIVIRERTFDYEYDTWIYEYGGKLYELLTDPGDEPNEDNHKMGFYIVDVERMDTVFDAKNGTVTNTVYYSYNDGLDSITSTVYLRSY